MITVVRWHSYDDRSVDSPQVLLRVKRHTQDHANDAGEHAYDVACSSIHTRSRQTAPCPALFSAIQHPCFKVLCSTTSLGIMAAQYLQQQPGQAQQCSRHTVALKTDPISAKGQAVHTVPHPFKITWHVQVACSSTNVVLLWSSHFTHLLSVVSAMHREMFPHLCRSKCCSPRTVCAARGQRLTASARWSCFSPTLPSTTCDITATRGAAEG